MKVPQSRFQLLARKAGEHVQNTKRKAVLNVCRATATKLNHVPAIDDKILRRALHDPACKHLTGKNLSDTELWLELVKGGYPYIRRTNRADTLRFMLRTGAFSEGLIKDIENRAGKSVWSLSDSAVSEALYQSKRAIGTDINNFEFISDPFHIASLDMPQLFKASIKPF